MTYPTEAEWNAPIPSTMTMLEVYTAFKQRTAYDTTITLLKSFPLPALTGGRLPVNTGLARHPSGNGWLVGDDGRAQNNKGTSGADGGVIHYNEDFTTVLANYKTISDFGLTGQYSIQGVAAIPGTTEFWCIARYLPANANSKVIRYDMATGTVLTSFLCQATANGIMVIDNHVYTLQITGELTKWTLAGVNVPPIPDLNASGSNDMLHYLGGNRFLMDYGDNGTNGVIALYDITAAPSFIRNASIPGANAIEGIVVHDEFLYVNNDGNYHLGGSNQNRVLKYSLGTLLNP